MKNCEVCREKKKERYRNRSAGTIGNERYRNRSAETIEKDLARRRHKYDIDEAFRLKTLSAVSTLLKSSVVCSECDKTMNYGSLLPHRKCCKGRNSKTTAQRILELSASFPDT